MSGQYLCRSPGRVAALRKAALASPPRLLNGIHYLEVAPDQRRVMLHFVHSLDLVPTAPLTAVNVEIRGGVRVRDPQVTGIHWIDEVMTVELASAGDFSPYLLRLVATPGAAAEPVGIDPALAEVEFRFKVDCPSDFDCRDDDLCPPTEADSPVIDYLARDYGSLLRLLLDRLSALMPDWRERNPADLWVALAEAVAFRGDELSYFQEAVATEAYLGTARRRVSVRRHTRLLDYALHDGCNARAWVAFEREVEEPADDGKTLAGCDPVTGLGGTLLLTGVPGMDPGIKADVAQTALGAGAQAFELLHPLILYSAHNRMHFYTWDHADCCLPLGATRALLRDDEANRLRLRRGDVLVLQSLLSNTSGELADADHRQRHAVRLTRVDPEADLEDMPTDGDALKRKVPPLRRDPVTDRPFVEIEWHADDALPFTLCLSKHIGGRLVEDMAGALGNVALADHGRTATDEVVLRPLPGGRLPRYPLDRTGVAPLTQQARLQLAGSEDTPLFDAAAGATAALHWEMADVRPALDLRSRDDGRRWTPRRDLLASDAEASDVVVETEDDGQAVLRFGDGINGRAPLPATSVPRRSVMWSRRSRASPGSATRSRPPGAPTPNRRARRGSLRPRPSGGRSAPSPPPTMRRWSSAHQGCSARWPLGAGPEAGPRSSSPSTAAAAAR